MACGAGDYRDSLENRVGPRLQMRCSVLVQEARNAIYRVPETRNASLEEANLPMWKFCKNFLTVI
jgi:hypothetical protein